MSSRVTSTRALIVLMLVLVAGWIVFITVRIAVDPLNRDRGGATVHELGDKLSRALSHEDGAVLGSTLDPDAEHRQDLADRYLEKVRDVEFVDTRAIPATPDSGPLVLARFRDRSGELRCTAFNVVTDEGRSYVDPTPGIAGVDCR